jgi:hypothetical protein
VNRRRLRLQPQQLALHVGDEQVRHVVTEALPHDDAQGREVGSMLRERIGGTCQPRSRSAFETSNTVKLSTSSLTVNAKTGSSSPFVSSSNGPSSAIRVERLVATSRAYACTRRYPSKPRRRKL